jgi:multicomponent Na+:H+ antiporter subunit D
MIGLLPPLPVVCPLVVAGLLLMFSHALPRPMPDVIALLAALAVLMICLVMAIHTDQRPLVYWFGNWMPRHGFPIGIGLVVDRVGASLSSFIALLFVMTMIFAWGYYDEVHAHFHVLMLLFMAGMIGFCLTHDLFNMFVWFEVMSVAGFALTGYQLRTSALEGALNFTITNTIGSYLLLAGIGLIYSHAGVLDFSALEQSVATAPDDIVVKASFALLASGLLIKAAQVPFQFWLSDAHSVAPSPISVIFSGAMVALGIYGVAKLIWSVFMPSSEIQHVIHTLLLIMGGVSIVVGGLMAITQRHVKRLLAFSTISHVGVMLVGLALLNGQGLSGMFIYLVGHGAVKGALFMLAGILLAMCGGIDEIGLRGRGREIWPAGVAMALGGLLLAGLPLGLMSLGTDFVEAAAESSGQFWVTPVIVIGAACTGGAVLRAAGRIFAGLGATPGEEERAPTDEEREKADRPLWLMLFPAALLLVFSLLSTREVGSFASAAAMSFMHPDNASILSVSPASAQFFGRFQQPPARLGAWVSVIIALAIASFNLIRQNLPKTFMKSFDAIVSPFLEGLQNIHSGRIGDYIAWLAAGVAMFVLAFALG